MERTDKKDSSNKWIILLEPCTALNRRTNLSIWTLNIHPKNFLHSFFFARPAPFPSFLSLYYMPKLLGWEHRRCLLYFRALQGIPTSAILKSGLSLFSPPYRLSPPRRYILDRVESLRDEERRGEKKIILPPRFLPVMRIYAGISIHVKKDNKNMKEKESYGEWSAET